MEYDQKPNKSKFELEGDVVNHQNSEYIEEQIELGKSKYRVTIAILSILTTISLVWAGISHYRIQQATAQIAKTTQYEEQLLLLKSELKKTSSIEDSLENIIYRGQTENDLLVENYETPIGVFFEVQIGGFQDFNLDKYNENLANLRLEKHDGKNKYLLGRFRSFNKAILFESDLKRMGIGSAFIVGRIDDQIVTYNEALKAQQKGNN